MDNSLRPKATKLFDKCQPQLLAREFEAHEGLGMLKILQVVSVMHSGSLMHEIKMV